jgi:adenosylcobinamide kinase / adenosylcobinamide-phosphate guanylyltransferase
MQRATLILGGARSGKSRYAESLITALPPPWTFVATAEAGDAEMVERIAAHRKRRGAQWQTVETPRDLVGALNAHQQAPILVDCLTLWLSNLLLAGMDLNVEIGRLEDAVAACAAPVVLVANEVGYGIVPDNALARRFRDWQGTLNQRIALLAECVVLVVAGLPLVVKGKP